MDKIFVKNALYEFLQTIYKFEQKELQVFSISWKEILLLKNLIIHGQHTMGNVNETLNIKAFQATRLIDGLEKKGLVSRFQVNNDKRVKTIEITEEGKSSIQALDDYHYSIIEKAAKEIGLDKAKEIIETMYHLEQLLGLSNNQ